ncbi:hypothetical protein [Aureimonas sp. ME7]|uniref:hypothetical protein n=1 Tax=Aureimonas sp. ME7 TaxID=2744252 RepID=UPI0015FE4636|nr:hypothetical protein [Aureimonas sp. ME7]
MDDTQPLAGGNLAAFRTYERCISMLVEVLASTGTDFKPSGDGQWAHFDSVRAALSKRLCERSSRNDISKAVEPLGITPAGDERDAEPIPKGIGRLGRSREVITVEDLSPNEVRSAMSAVVDARFGTERLILRGREFFRASLDVIQVDEVMPRRINVVQGNFHRLFGYLRELILDDGRIAIHGVGHRLDTLKIRIGPKLRD